MKGSIHRGAFLLLYLASSMVVLYHIFSPVFGMDTKAFVYGAAKLFTEFFGIG